MLIRSAMSLGGALEDRQQASLRFKAAPRVLVVTDIGGAYGNRVRQGAIRYAGEQRHWKLLCLADFMLREAFGCDQRGQPRYEGMIVQTTDVMVDYLAQGKMPVVNVSDRRADLLERFPSVVSDNAAIGRLGAEHLLVRNFRRLAFCGMANCAYATQRRNGFRALAADAGREVDEYWMNLGGDYETDLRAWLRSLPPRTGVMASNDVLAWHIVAGCAACGISVPWEIAVLGVDDDPMLCASAACPISSIVIEAERVGYEAAKLLDGLMRGTVSPADQGAILLPPRSVVLRQSSDVVASDDPLVVRAVRFIRERITRPVTVTEIADHLDLSPRALELKFRASIGSSPSAVIRQIRVEHVKKLMDHTETPLYQIAGENGFRDLACLIRMFRQVTGLHPQQYRDRTRRPGRVDRATA